MPESKIVYTDETGQEHSLDEKEAKKHNRRRGPGFLFFILLLVFSLVMGAVGAMGSLMYLSANPKLQEKLGLANLSNPFTKTEKIKLEESSAITDTVKKVSPAVVSISVSSNYTDLFGRTYTAEGGGTGFIITSDGLIATNKHVVSDDNAEYTVFTADGKDYKAKIVAKDSANDLAVIKIEATGLPTVELGNSGDISIGQWVIAVGNALGEFQNSVTVGVISAKDRHITASGGGQAEKLEGLLQTDTAINSGNSGGPLLNLAGQVIGINTAVAGEAQNIGFAIPIDAVKKAIDSIKKTGEIKRPMLGIRYVAITKEIAKLNKLDVNYGAWVLRGESRSEAAVIPSSPADKAGLEENDIILEINGQKINENNSLSKIISDYDINDTITLKVLHDGKEKEVKVKLEEMK